MTALIAPIFVTLIVISLAVALPFYVAAAVGPVGATLFLVGVLVGVGLSIVALSVARDLIVPWLRSRA